MVGGMYDFETVQRQIAIKKLFLTPLPETAGP